MIKRTFVSLIFGLAVLMSILAQKSFVLWDKTSGIPIPMASAYTTSNGTVKSAFSDEMGRVVLNFTFDSLTVSHVNYQKISLTAVPDTLFLEQSVNLLQEVIVFPASEPEWIRPLLMDFIKTKDEKYKDSSVLGYNYETENIGDSTLYKFVSKGLLRRNKLFEISPSESVITYRDHTAGCDYSNLKNTFYHDFVSDMDKGFVKGHRFYVDEDTDASAPDIIRINFKSKKKDVDDAGYICIDTVQNVILRARRTTGLKYNVSNRTSPLVRASFSGLYGLQYKDWKTDVQSEYRFSGDSWYLSRCHYLNFIHETFDGKKRKGDSVYNMTSTYTAVPYDEDENKERVTFLELPKPFAMKIIMSGKERHQEEKLQSVEKKYVIY